MFKDNTILFDLLVTKKMSKVEKGLYNSLMDGLNKQIVLANTFINSREYRGIRKNMDEDDFTDWFNNSSLMDDLNILTDDNIVDSRKHIINFFSIGSVLGYQQLKRKDTGKYSEYNNRSLQILTDYTDDLFYDVNHELTTGIKDTLYTGVTDKKSSVDLKTEMLTLMAMPILSVVNLDNRCEMIARTEHSRGVNTGTLQTYSNYHVTEANIITSGMSNVCDDCLELEANNPYTLQEAQKLLPFHPFCNCSYEPIISSVDNDSDIEIIDLTN